MTIKNLLTQFPKKEIDCEVLIQSMLQGVVIQNTAGEIIFANSASERVLGLTADQMRGRTSMDPRWKAVKEDGSDFPGEEHPSSVSLRTGKTVQGVIMGVFHPAWNRHKWIRIDAFPLFIEGKNEPHQVVATFNDVSAQKQAEDDLKQTEQRFRRLFEAATEGVALHEVIYNGDNSPVDYRILDINPSYTAHTTIERKTAIGALASKLYGVNPPPFLDLYANVAESGEPMAFESYVESMNKHFKIAVYSPEPKQFVTVFEDITGQKKAERERETKVKLQGAIEMAGAACHELNQPLQILTGILELLAIQNPESQDYGASLDLALLELGKLGKITKKIQNITRYETKTYMGDTRIFDIDKASDLD